MHGFSNNATATVAYVTTLRKTLLLFRYLMMQH